MNPNNPHDPNNYPQYQPPPPAFSFPPPPAGQFPGAFSPPPPAFVNPPMPWAQTPAPFTFPDNPGAQFDAAGSPAAFPPTPESALRMDPTIQLPKSLNAEDLLHLPDEDPDELIQNRFICRRSITLWAGSSGVGKSTLVTGLAVSMSNGREFFGFRPKRPLRVMMVQAENDEYDMKEMILCAQKTLRSGGPINLNNIVFVRENKLTGARFCELLRRLILKHKPDLVVIDPVLAYLGGDSNLQAVVSEFLRNLLQPVLDETNVAVILVHHTAKGVQNKAGGTATRSDGYAGAGSAEWMNASRVVITLQTTSAEGVIELQVPKRGARLGLHSKSPKHKASIYIKHGKSPGDALTETDAPQEEKVAKKSSGRFTRA